MHAPVNHQRRRLALALLAMPALPLENAHAATPGDPLALKLLIVGRRKPGTTLAEHRHHIRRVHGELVLGYIAADAAHAPRRYVQNTVFDGQFRATAPGSDPLALNRDFVTQVWFPDFAALARSRETRYYLDKLKGDEDNFVDQASVVFLPSRERVLHARAGGAPAGTVKLMGFLQRAGGVAEAAFERGWAEAVAKLPRAAVQRHVQNRVASPPAAAGKPPAVDGIDELWLEDEAAARALLGAWQAAVRESLVRPGLVAEGSPFALLMHEDVIHAGART
ncbi:MAG TPA: EthD domain-containing protein [Methylibium sp.]|uniref:EthD domain-containing protein n=1 Tax=Methylibium sp. TaxID=2067992 RepID=UPI002DBB4986|nr:EthD domain-containing protein [Methylibium sp.]HEU4460049.1 EthD domain-containing protein [Methylibium sp.]